MGKFGYHTSFLKNLLSRIESAAKGTIHFTDCRRKAQLEIAIIFDFDFDGKSKWFKFDNNSGDDRYRRQWITIAADSSHSRNKRYMTLLDKIIKGSGTILNVSTALGFDFSSIEELDMKLSINGY